MAEQTIAELTINGYEVPGGNLLPYTKTRSDIHSSTSGRGETGVMNISYVRTGVRKLDVELKNITAEQYAKLDAAVATKPQSVTIRSITGAAESFTAYNSDITETKKLEDSSGRYYDVSFSLTEV